MWAGFIANLMFSAANLIFSASNPALKICVISPDVYIDTTQADDACAQCDHSVRHAHAVLPPTDVRLIHLHWSSFPLEQT